MELKKHFSKTKQLKSIIGFGFLFVIAVFFQNCSQFLEVKNQPGPISESDKLTTELRNKSSSGSETELLEIAETRQYLLLQDIEKNANEILRLQISPELRSKLPESVQAHLEEPIEVDGDLVVLHIDDEKDQSKSRYEYEVQGKDGKVYSLHLAKSLSRELLTGSTVRVRGLELVEALGQGKSRNHLVTESEDNILLLAANNATTYGSQPGVQPNTIGEQKTLVMMVNFQDAPSNKPWTVSDMLAFFTNQIIPFFNELSYNQSQFKVTIFGWQTIATNSTSCDRTAITNLADQAATSAGYILSEYDRLIYSFPVSSACGWGGLGTVGGKPSRAWLNGSFNKSSYAHELGHNLGLFHSHDLVCSGKIIGTVGVDCSVREYGDIADIMSGNGGHFNIYEKDRLGWINSNLTTVTSSGRYRIAPHEFSSSLPLGLKVLKSVDVNTGAKTWYYLEYRQAIGADSGLSWWDSNAGGNLTKGLAVHTGVDISGNTSYLLDMNPSTATFADAALVPGKSFSDSNAGVSFTVQSVSSTDAVVDIQISGGNNTPVCTRSAPSLVFNPTQSAPVVSGTAVDYLLTVINNDSAECSNSTIALSASPPSGWSTSLASSIVLAPGASGNLTLKVTSSLTAIDGSYNVTVVASANATSKSGSVVYVVKNPTVDTTAPSVSITSPANGATVSGIIAISASASDNVAVSKVEFYVDGVLKLSDVSAPYSLNLDTKLLSNGSHVLMAKAIDSSSNSSSAQISVNVSNAVADTTAPNVAITSPANGDIINPRTSITIQASASDNVGVIKVEFYVNGSLICTDTTASYACGYNLPGAKGASYQIEARAYDSAGNIGSHQIQILSSGTATGGGKGRK